jgi:hypothetical protein
MKIKSNIKAGQETTPILDELRPVKQSTIRRWPSEVGASLK